MKKILLVLSMIAIFSMPTICQDAYEVNVNWTEFCDCLGYDQNNYFKVTIVIHDDANNVTVEPGITETTGGTEDEINIPTPNVETYCGQQHTKQPIFTIRATVWFMETSTNPETVCCSGAALKNNQTCSDFANGIAMPEIILN